MGRGRAASPRYHWRPLRGAARCERAYCTVASAASGDEGLRLQDTYRLLYTYYLLAGELTRAKTITAHARMPRQEEAFFFGGFPSVQL